MRNIAFLFLLFGFLGCASAWAQSVPAFFPEDMIVSASALNLREQPDKNAPKIASLKRGDLVQFVEAHNNGEYMEADSLWAPWLKVRYQGKTGYAFGAYLSGTFVLDYEGSILNSLPPLQWYGVYQRDSFADELRRVEVTLSDEYNEFYGGTVKSLKTNQKERSKFLIGTLQTFKGGYVGPLGVFEVKDYAISGDLGPGAMIGLHPGNEINDTTLKASYTLAATGCARLEDMSVKVSDYRLSLIDYSTATPTIADLSSWFKTTMPDSNPNVSLLWYGDLDQDNKPDAIFNDCPYEVGCRSSLFLSSKAKPGQYLKKVCEHFWEGD